MNIDALEALANTLRERLACEILVTKVDVASTAQVGEWLSSTVEHFGAVYGGANIAGIAGKEFGVRDARDVSDDDFDAVMRINVRGVMVCQRAQLRHIEAGGAIVNVASVAGKMGQPKSLSYTASKHAVVGMTRVAASEISTHGVRVNAVAP